VIPGCFGSSSIDRHLAAQADAHYDADGDEVSEAEVNDFTAAQVADHVRAAVAHAKARPADATDTWLDLMDEIALLAKAHERGDCAQELLEKRAEDRRADREADL
jgi:hypothetical protein